MSEISRDSSLAVETSGPLLGEELVRGGSEADRVSSDSPSSGFVCACLFFCGLLLFFVGLGSSGPERQAEERALDAAESVYSGQGGLIPIVEGEQYVKKPPLYAWMAAGVSRVFGGVDSFTVRLPAALGGLLCVILTFFVGKDLRDAQTGFLGAVILATTYRFNFVSHLAMVDVPLAAAILAVLVGSLRLRSRGDSWGTLSVAAGTCAATLFKGHVGWIWIAIVLVAARLALGRAPKRFGRKTTFGIGLGLLGSLWWFVYAMAATPSSNGTFLSEVMMRFGEGVRHAKPLWFYPASIVEEAFPWSLLFPAVGYYLWKIRKSLSPDLKMYLLWFAGGLVIFSFSSAKQPHYLIPLYPSIALATAVVLLNLRLEQIKLARLLRAGLYGVAVAMAAGGVGMVFYSYFILGLSLSLATAVMVLLLGGAYIVFCFTHRGFCLHGALTVVTVLCLITPLFYAGIFPAKIEVSQERPSYLAQIGQERRDRALMRLQWILQSLEGGKDRS